MEDKVKRIRAEIERLKESGCASPIVICDTLLAFIDSMQEETKTGWIQELQERLDSLSKEDFDKVWSKYKLREEGSVDYDKLNTMLDESLSTETKESWNERLGEEPASDYLEEEIDKYIKDNFTIDTEQLDRFGIEEKDYLYTMGRGDILAMVRHFTNWQKEL